MLNIRASDGSKTMAVFTPDVAIVISKPLRREVLRSGDIITFNTTDVQLPDERLLIAGIYLQADPSVPEGDQEYLTREFLPASGRHKAPDTSSHTTISGRLIAVEPTSVLVENSGKNLRVKLSPEAVGESVRRGELAVLHPSWSLIKARNSHGNSMSAIISRTAA